MSVTLSHEPWVIRPWPERAIEPTILYLHVGQEIPAAAANTAAGWQCVTFGANFNDPILPDEQAARDWLTTYAWETAK